MSMNTLQAPTNGRRTLHVSRPVSMPSMAVPKSLVTEHEALSAQPVVQRFDDADLTVARLDSASLLCGQKTVQIAHNGSVYKLQATKLGKLILTK
ncbi:hemin uptake protein HemP [Ottowia thiooxydans]|uniref:hemin uptake protein HemP n=1 Tax=Ottowia thiooxydans TaxID=219182 RepID=UPI00048ADE47|nr:hemin uptake protein HemP [Ottowia thiooxydans]